MESKTINKVHTVNVYGREKIEVVGANLVVSSTEKEIILKLKDDYMLISGTDLVVTKLVPEEEYFVASGNILGLHYQSKYTKKSFFGKVFK